MIRLQLFGTPRITLDGVVVEITTRKAWSVIGYLAAHSDRPVGRSRLAGELWGDFDEARARAALATTLWRLKTALQPAGDTRLLHSLGDRLALAPGSVESDVSAFRHLAADPRVATDVLDGEALELLETACALHSGGFLDGVDEDWCLVAREAFRSAVVSMLERLVTTYSEAQRHQDVVRVGHRLLAEEPFVEHVHRAIIVALGAMGERAIAARQFNECARMLREELGLSPAPETVDAYRRAVGEVRAPASSGTVFAVAAKRPDGRDRDDQLAYALSCLREATSTLDGLRRRN